MSEPEALFLCPLADVQFPQYSAGDVVILVKEKSTENDPAPIKVGYRGNNVWEFSADPSEVGVCDLHFKFHLSKLLV